MTTTEDEKETARCRPNPDADMTGVEAGQRFSVSLFAKKDGEPPELTLGTDNDLSVEVALDSLVDLCHGLLHHVAAEEFRDATLEYLDKMEEQRWVSKRMATMMMIEILQDEQRSHSVATTMIGNALPGMAEVLAAVRNVKVDPDPGGTTTGQYL